MRLPPGFERQGEQRVCRLHKSLYGLKQASRNWFSTFSSALNRAGYTQSAADYSLFTQVLGTSYTAVLIYVDDIVVTGKDPSSIKNLKDFLSSQFNIKDLGPLNYFLGIETTYSGSAIHLSQSRYIQNLLLKAKMDDAKPCAIPIAAGVQLSQQDGDPFSDPHLYRSIVGALL